MGESLIVQIVNPKSGDETGSSFVSTHVSPLLAKHGINIDVNILSKAPGDAGDQLSQLLESHVEVDSVTLIVAGGDGTLHEIVNSVVSNREKYDRFIEIKLVIIPTGTANALYASMCSPDISSHETIEGKLCSVKALLDTQSSTPRVKTHLTIAQTCIYPPSALRSNPATTIYSIVVASTALHASILHDSEALREEYPDLRRFKIAAEKNITRWYPGQVTLKAPPGGVISIYDQSTTQFTPFINHDNVSSNVTLPGPFVYFLSTVNVDRLEPSFVISPLQTKIRPIEDTMDIVIIRPKRDPTIVQDTNSEDDRRRFAEKTMHVLHAAYKDGAHIDLGYLEDGSLHDYYTKDCVRGVIEYLRCGGWEWKVVR